MLHLNSYFGSVTTLELSVDPVIGTYELNPSTVSKGHSASLDLRYYAYSYGSKASGGQMYVTIEKIDGLGGTVKGSIYGILSSNNNSIPEPIRISGGKFEVRRE